MAQVLHKIRHQTFRDISNTIKGVKIILKIVIDVCKDKGMIIVCNIQRVDYNLTSLLISVAY